ncbi:hypothetical protein [Streptomyces griseorubiginosus]|uniref:hypothetical protein n=1 Tax=Streptomyces griseorubiginosus TaxID=67304 RepID=UPI0033DEAB11
MRTSPGPPPRRTPAPTSPLLAATDTPPAPGERGIRARASSPGDRAAHDRGGGRTGDSLTLSTDGRVGGARPGTANPRTDVPNSTIGEPGPAAGRCRPSRSNTFGRGSDVFDLGKVPGSGGDQLAFRLVAQRDAAWAGVLCAAVDARQ